MGKYITNMRLPYAGDHVIHHFVKYITASDTTLSQQLLNEFFLDLEGPLLPHPVIVDVIPMPHKPGHSDIVVMVHYFTIG